MRKEEAIEVLKANTGKVFEKENIQYLSFEDIKIIYGKEVNKLIVFFDSAIHKSEYLYLNENGKNNVKAISVERFIEIIDHIIC